MSAHRIHLSTLFLALVAAALAFAASRAESGPSKEELLARLARVALLYRDAALEFTCDETIRWREIEGQNGGQRFAYVFTFSEERGFEDYRIDPGWKAKNPEPVRLPIRAPSYLSSAYLWVFVFRESRQPFHRYSIAGEEPFDGRTAIRIDFEPMPPIRDAVNDWYGTAWVDRDSSQLLRVEAYSPDDFATKAALDEHLAKADRDDRTYEVRRIVTDFGQQKNGMRFPSRVEIDQVRHKVRGMRGGRVVVKEKPVLAVTQTYEDYRFFSVRTEAEISEFVTGARQLDLRD